MPGPASDIHIVEDILKIMLEARPDSDFIKSLYQQFCERGGLSKKQLEGLHAKAAKVKSVPVGRLATLEAIIRQRPTRHRSVATITAKTENTNEEAGQQMIAILEKFPQHKRILFLKSKFDHKEPLNTTEITEIQKFVRLLLK